MSADKFDKELASLYQQRKQQTNAPKITLTSEVKPIKSARSPWHILALLLTGGVASFGIMALISHLGKTPIHGESEQYKQHSVRIIEVVAVKPEALPLPSVPPLPPKPESSVPEHAENSQVSQENLMVNTDALSLNKAINQSVKPPEIKQLSMDILPIYRVMPEYPKSALYARKSGTVKLQYRISNDGKVVDIVGLNKNGIRSLERSAKQALMQWRYPAKSGSDKKLEIEFEFNLTQ